MQVHASNLIELPYPSCHPNLDQKKSLATSTWALQLCDHQIISIFCSNFSSYNFMIGFAFQVASQKLC